MDTRIFRTGTEAVKSFEARSDHSLISKIFSGMTVTSTSKREKMFGSAAGKCPRHSFLVQTVPVTETTGPSSLLYMNIGNAMHETICDGMFKAGILIFKEYRIKPPAWLNISGKVDALYDDDGELAILEIKSCGNQIPAEPKEDHAFQAQVYSLITGVDRVNLLYASRDVGLPKPKMGVVPVEITAATLQSIARKLVVAAIGIREGKAPAIPAYFKSSACKYCSFYTFCWDGAPVGWSGEDLDEKRFGPEIDEKVKELLEWRPYRRESLIKYIREFSNTDAAKRLFGEP